MHGTQQKAASKRQLFLCSERSMLTGMNTSNHNTPSTAFAPDEQKGCWKRFFHNNQVSGDRRVR